MAISMDIGDKRTKKPNAFSESASESSSVTKQESLSGGVLDEKLLMTILSGLSPQMSDAQIEAYAKSLLDPELNAGIEAAQQAYDTTKLAKEQEIENLAATLARSIAEQNSAYAQNMSAIESGALARGMGRSSYTLQTLANQGKNYAAAVQQLTEDNARQQNQIQQQITQAAQQNAQTQGRLNTDYATKLAAKIQELRNDQKTSYDQNYMTAVSASMGTKSTNTSTTTGSENSATVSGKIEKKDNKTGGSSSGKTGSTVSSSGTYDHL